MLNKKTSLASAIAATFVGGAALFSMPAQAASCTVSTTTRTSCKAINTTQLADKGYADMTVTRNGYSQVRYKVYRGATRLVNRITEQYVNPTVLEFQNTSGKPRYYRGELSEFTGLLGASAKIEVKYR